MNEQLADGGAAISRFVLHIHPRSRDTVNDYRCILVEFQRHVQPCSRDTTICLSTIESWLHGCASRWAEHYVLHRARVVDRFLDFLASEGSIPNNPIAQLRHSFGQRDGTPIVRALLSPDPAQALEALKPLPQFASVHGAFMRSHIELMRASGYRYKTQASSFLRFDRFLQGRADAVTLPLTDLLQQWVAEGTTLHHGVERQQVARNLARAWQRIDPRVELPKVDRRLSRQRVLEQRRPYIYTPQEVRLPCVRQADVGKGALRVALRICRFGCRPQRPCIEHCQSRSHALGALPRIVAACLRALRDKDLQTRCPRSPQAWAQLLGIRMRRQGP